MTDLLTNVVTVRGGTYRVREMKGTERYHCADLQEKEGSRGMAGWLLKRCVLEPRNFNLDDVPAVVCEALFNEIIKLSGTGVDAVGDAEKKSDPATSLESGTD